MSDQFEDEGEASEESSSRLLSSWVLELRTRFAERESLTLPAGVEGTEDLPRVVFLVALCVVDEALCVVLSLEEDLAVSESEVRTATLPAREALVDGETGEDPADEWFAPIGWDEPLVTPDDDASDENPGRREEGSSSTEAPDPLWGAATALVREHYTEDVKIALQVGQLDDQLLVGRRCVGCVVALPRSLVLDREELESVLVVPLDELISPDHVEEEEVVVLSDDEGATLRERHSIYFLRGKRIPGPSVRILQALLERLGLVDLDPADA